MKTSLLYPLWGVFERETLRYLRDPFQTLVNSVLTNLLLIVALVFLSPERADILIPGVVILASYHTCASNVRMTIFLGKIEGSIYYQLAAPIPRTLLYFTYVLSSVVRSSIINTALLIISISLYGFSGALHLIIFILAFITINIICANISIIMALHYRNWNSFGALENYIMTPMLFLGGTLYTLTNVPKSIAKIITMNPFFHMTNLLRWSYCGYSDVSHSLSMVICLALLILTTVICYILFKKGYKLLK